MENPGNAPGLRCLQGNAALLRDPREIWSPTCDSNAEAAVSETARYAEIPVSWGLKLGAIARFRSGASAFTARDADHYTTIAIVVGQGGWTRSSGLRLPTPALFQLSYTLHVGCRTWNLTKDLSLIGRSLSMLSYTAVSKPCSRRTRRRTAASQTGLACETEMRRPWRFHPGRKLAPRSGLEPLSNALTVRCLAISAIAE